MANVKQIEIVLFFEPDRLTETAQVELQRMLGLSALPWAGLTARIQKMTISQEGDQQDGYAVSIKGREAISWRSLDNFVRALKDSAALILKARAKDVENCTDWEELG